MLRVIVPLCCATSFLLKMGFGLVIFVGVDLVLGDDFPAAALAPKSQAASCRGGDMAACGALFEDPNLSDEDIADTCGGQIAGGRHRGSCGLGEHRLVLRLSRRDPRPLRTAIRHL